MPYKDEKKWIPPGRIVRDDKQIGNTSAWSYVERAKNAGVPEVQGWRKDKQIVNAAAELRCFDSVNSLIETLQEKIRERKGK